MLNLYMLLMKGLTELNCPSYVVNMAPPLSSEDPAHILIPGGSTPLPLGHLAIVGTVWLCR